MARFISNFSLDSSMSDDIHELLFRLAEHIWLTLSSVSLAILIAFPLACLAWANRPLRTVLVTGTQIAQTIPSLALLALLLPFLGIGKVTAVTVLVVYAILPIVRNTLTGLAETPSELMEAGENLGMNQLQILWHVQIPHGLPIIVGGIRTATVWSVGTATLSAFIGAGGLGDFITRGLALQNTKLLLMGAIPAALLAVLLDLGLGQMEARSLRWKNGSSFWRS